MDKKARLEKVLERIHQARTQLVLHPDVFDATELLKISETELSELIFEMFPQEG